MGQFVDLTGEVFGSLIVVERDRVVNGGWNWNCRCVCGNIKSIRSSSLIQGATKSCGCLMQATSTIHGLTKTKEHRTWQGIQQRCHNPNNKDYKRYGGRGIKVCDEWREDFLNFLNDVGYAPSKDHSLDRIDNGGNYEPGNVRWATAKEQARNRRNRGMYPIGIHRLATGKYIAQINVNGKSKHLGSFWNIEDAIVVRKQAEEVYWKG